MTKSMCVVLVCFLMLRKSTFNGRYIVDFVNKTSRDKADRAQTVQSVTGG